VYKPSRLVSSSWVLVSHRSTFRLPVVVLPSVRQFSTILSVNEISSGCFGSAEQGESNDWVTTSRGVSLFVLRITFDMSRKGVHARSYATTGIALRVKTDLYRIFDCAQAPVWANCWHFTPNSKSWSHKYNQAVFEWRLHNRQLQNLYSEQNTSYNTAIKNNLMGGHVIPMEKIRTVWPWILREEIIGSHMCRRKGNTGSLFYLTNIVCHFQSVRLSWNVAISSDRPYARCNNCSRCHGIYTR
jgi:hypothetical protein